MHAPHPPLPNLSQPSPSQPSPAQPIPAQPSQADLTSPDGIPILAASVHTVVGTKTNHHDIPGKNEEKREEWKAICARRVLEELKTYRQHERHAAAAAAAAHASSQGQVQVPVPRVPRIIMAGDLSCTKDAVKKEMQK